MPGLNQLKAFSLKVKDLGDEINIRAQRGEKPADLPFPEGISEADDSEDFVLGLPETKTDNDNASSDDSAAEELPLPDALAEAEQSLGAGDASPVPDLDSILNPQTTGADVPDLSDFLDTPEAAPEPEETPLEDLDLESLLKPSEPESAGEEVSDSPVEEGPSIDELLGTSSDAETSGGDDISSLMDGLGDLSDLDSLGATDAPDTIPDIDNLMADSLPVEEPAEITEPEAAPVEDNTSESGDDDFAFSGDIIDMNEGLPDDVAETDAGVAEMPAPEEETVSDDMSVSEEMPAVEDFTSTDSFDVPEESSFEAPEDFSMDAPSSDSLEMPENDFEPGETFEEPSPSGFDTPDFDLPETSSEPAEKSDDLSQIFDTSGLDFPEDNGESGGQSVDAAMDVPPEVFDTSEMDGLSFSSSEDGGSGIDDFPVTEGIKEEDDFILDENFEIPGFSDTETAQLDKKKKSARIDTADFSQAVLKPKNTLTEKEYEQFRTNLNEYPLNVRVALEELIVKNEFTDEAVFEVIQKVLKKVSARQLATHLEKMLDIAINVPRDFERRSFAQYEAYKGSFQYQLRNRIIPGIIAAVLILMTGYVLFDSIFAYIYKPAKANKLYKQGYTLLQNNDYEQSDIKFREAAEIYQSEDWFFKYARGYRDHHQYERSALIYDNLLLNPKFMKNGEPNKIAALEYARMRAFDEAKYEDAEYIIKRKGFENYKLDPDAKLLLGDINLEWGEINTPKFAEAKNYYQELEQTYPKESLYKARMLRYYIRTDKLSKVLAYKGYFYPNKNSAKKKALEGEDWTELSGYLLDKLYGKLTPDEEYLRGDIEDVLGMLQFACETDGKNPVSSYNMARYHIFNNNTDSAKSQLKKSISLFKEAEKRTRRNTYKEINAARLLGELYVKGKEYSEAEETYTYGINVYQFEHKYSDFEGDENTGKLYADLGDIHYFKGGSDMASEMDAALTFYESAIETHYDVPSINYRVGAIRYNRKEYDQALMSFIKTSEQKLNDSNLLLALGNTLSLRGDNYGAQTYYSNLLEVLNGVKASEKVLFPRTNKEDYIIVDKFLKVNNNLGVTLYRLAKQTGDSKKNAEAIVRLSDSQRAWDALTRNEKTMVRLDGSNLAEQNLKYMTRSFSDFEPAIYTDIPKILDGDNELK